MNIPAFYYLGFWFIYQLLLGFVSLSGLSSGVAFWAHIGGFAVGAIVVKVFRVKPRFKRGTERVQATSERSPITPFVWRPQIRKPFVDVISEGDIVRIYAELPGVEESEIRLKVSAREVEVSAGHGEIRYLRQIKLPVQVIPQIRNLNFRNGVLSFYLYAKT